MRDRTIAEHMTPAPKCIQKDQTVADAYQMMRGWNVRHLPVLDGERVIGIVSQRDLYRLETIVDVDRPRDPLSDAMDEAYLVAQDAPLSDVARNGAPAQAARAQAFRALVRPSVPTTALGVGG